MPAHGVYMGVTQTESEAAIEQAETMDGDGTVTHKKSEQGRHTFSYDGLLDAHLLDDGWRFVGIGTGWFALRREE